MNAHRSPEEEHLTEVFNMDDLCAALDKFPAMALSFVSELSFVSSGDFYVQEGVTRADLGPRGRLVLGSERRALQHLWKKKVRGDTPAHEVDVFNMMNTSLCDSFRSSQLIRRTRPEMHCLTQATRSLQSSTR